MDATLATASGIAVPWDRPRVLGLAGDRAVGRAAAGVVGRSWSGAGCAGTQLVWGRCRGSGAEPYEVVADPSAPAYACTCPSRKQPCKHALALLLRWVDGQLGEGEPPGFATRWQQRRADGPATRPDPARPPGVLADPVAAATRAAARVERVAGGLAELETWIGDQLRSGLAGLERGGYAQVDTVAARMVDAQAPGVASLLRAIPSELAREGWPERVLEQLAALHLLIRAHQRLDQLPVDLAATVRARIGYPVTRNDVLATLPLTDDWLAVGQLDSVEYRLESRRVWLWGSRTRRWALWLTFCPPGGTPDSTVTAGTTFAGGVHFYPGAGSYRVVLGSRTGSEAAADESTPVETVVTHPPAGPAGSGSFPPAETLAQARDRFAALLAADPWATRMPAVVQAAPVPPVDGGTWRLRDAQGHCRPVVGLGTEPWPLLAQSCGAEVPVMVEWSGAGVRPLAVLTGSAVGRAV